MKRREFIKSTAVAGAAAFGKGCSSMKAAKHSGPGFDVHPFVKNHPEAVFICLTDVDEKTNAQEIKSWGQKLSKELIVKVPDGGFPLTTKVTVKPNWTCAGPKDGKPVVEKMGTVTDLNFVEGWVGSMKELGLKDYYIRECACSNTWEVMGYYAMCERAGIDLRPLARRMNVWEMKEGEEVIWANVKNGVMMRKIAYQAPMNEPGTFLVNIAKMKTHGMGVTATIKNLQGIGSTRFHNMCTPVDSIRRRYGQYLKYFHRNFDKSVKTLYKQHLDEGYPRWARSEPPNRNGLWMETWCQRILDSYSVTPTGLNIVEGIYSQDGNGFGIGPHPKLGPYGVTSRDYLSNNVIFGMDPFRIDIITHWLAGHEPGNFGLFHIGIERGFSDVLDPSEIPVYLWKDGKATLAKLVDFKRTPLVTYYQQRDWGGQNEPEFHLCDEPFDYSAWKNGAKLSECTPSFRNLGTDNEGRMVSELTVPKKDDVYIDVLDKRGDLIARLRAPDLEPGVHQVVWDGFESPGLHNFYVKGMGWDEKLQEVIYS